MSLIIILIDAGFLSMTMTIPSRVEMIKINTFFAMQRNIWNACFDVSVRIGVSELIRNIIHFCVWISKHIQQI